MDQADFLVAHNISFDEKIMGAEFLRKNMPNTVVFKKQICTKEISTNFAPFQIRRQISYKWPKLSELHQKLFGAGFEDSHNAMADVSATSKCFFEIKRRGIFKNMIKAIIFDFEGIMAWDNKEIFKKHETKHSLEAGSLDNIMDEYFHGVNIAEHENFFEFYKKAKPSIGLEAEVLNDILQEANSTVRIRPEMVEYIEGLKKITK